MDLQVVELPVQAQSLYKQLRSKKKCKKKLFFFTPVPFYKPEAK